MDEDRNIRLTVVQSEDAGEAGLRIDLARIFGYLKRLFVLWLALAVGLGGVAAGVGIWLRNSTYNGDAMALIGYSYDGASSGLTPAGGKLDPTKITSPAVVEAALAETKLGEEYMDPIRMNVKVTSLMSDEARDQMLLYEKLLEKNANMDVVRTLLNTKTRSTRYIVSFDYLHAGLTRETGIVLLNALLEAYRSYFEDTYNYTETLGSSLNVLDYKDYDFYETVAIFSDALDDIQSYLRRVDASDSSAFRSTETGYTMNDLYERADLLKDVDLDQISAYISLNHVTRNGPDREITHYQWVIENLTHLRAVQEAALASLTETINTYQKDPVIYSAEGEITDGETDTYDTLIGDKLSAQSRISRYSRTIRYYESVIEDLQTGEKAPPEMVAQADADMAALSEKVQALLNDVNATVDEYYEKASFEKTVRLLVPALAKPASITGGTTKKILLLTEGGLFVLYLGAAVILGLRSANRRDETPENPESSSGS